MPFIRLQLGRDVTADELLDDWVLVHEMIHLALPEVGDDHLWLTEGLSTYVEGIARVHVGDLRSGLADLEQRLTALLKTSQVLQHSLRLDSARRLLRRGVAAVAGL